MCANQPLTFDLTFSGPLRMGTGVPGSGLDEVVDPNALIDASGIKGVLRASARLLFTDGNEETNIEDRSENGDRPIIKAIFGVAGIMCPWNFDVVVEPMNAATTSRAEVRIGDNGVAEEGGLFSREEVWVSQAKLTIVQRRPLTNEGVPEGARFQPADAHGAVLRLAARLSEKIGQRKTRGMGWVNMTPVGLTRNLLEGDLKILEALREVN